MRVPSSTSIAAPRRIARSARMLGLGTSALALAIGGTAGAQTVEQGGKPRPHAAGAEHAKRIGLAHHRCDRGRCALLPTPARARPRSIRDPVAAAADQGDANDIIVTGIRASLANAQNIKRDADTVVDAITAQDIGALPDRSVTEALQRVPGVSIGRFAAGNDPDHFSVEGSGVVVRGLNYVRSEFNGRDTFSANGGRSLNFQDVSPELLGSVEVYKNMTADQIEGGIAGTVNLNTRKPFDSRDKQQLYISADVNYADLIEPRRARDLGAVHATISTPRSDASACSSAAPIRSSSAAPTASRSRITSSASTAAATSTATARPRPTPSPALPPDRPSTPPWARGYGRRNSTASASAPPRRCNIRPTTNRCSQRCSSSAPTRGRRGGEHTFETTPDGIDRQTFPARGTAYTFDDDGLFQTGRITLDRGYTPPGGEQFGMINQLSNRGVKTRAKTDDFGANIKWNATDRLSINLDGQ